jgi:hypothetical protein
MEHSHGAVADGVSLILAKDLFGDHHHPRTNNRSDKALSRGQKTASNEQHYGEHQGKMPLLAAKTKHIVHLPITIDRRLVI